MTMFSGLQHTPQIASSKMHGHANVMEIFDLEVLVDLLLDN